MSSSLSYCPSPYLLFICRSLLLNQEFTELARLDGKLNFRDPPVSSFSERELQAHCSFFIFNVGSRDSD